MADGELAAFSLGGDLMKPPERSKRALEPAVRLRTAEYAERDGRKFKVQVPFDWPEHSLQAGIPLGPPDLDTRLKERGWPKYLRIRLHNQLFERGLLTVKDIQRNPQGLEAALKATLKTDMQTLHQWYFEEGTKGV